LPPFIRNALFGPAGWAALLAAVIVVPILGITLIFVHDIERQSAAADAERAGIAQIAALSDVFGAASNERAARVCDRRPVRSAPVDRSIAKMNTLDAQHQFTGPLWREAARAIRSLAPMRSSAAVRRSF
jgi:hypothetical protein